MPELALPPPAAPVLLREGAALGVWRIDSPLHGGDGDSSGQWYRARHALAADQVAVLLLLPRSERAAGIMLRYADQAHELGQLKHADLAVPTDSGVTPSGQPYLMLDWAEGQPILRACASLGLRERLQLMVQLCELLRYAHQQGWLLAEIDPAMIWVDARQRIKLMGTGLLRMPDPSDPFERGMGLGSQPGYASPEALAGEPPSLGSEVYGLGALLCMLVDGRLPSMLGSGVDDVSPSASWAKLNAAEQFSLDALLHKAAAPYASRRHVSAEALADDLRAWLAGENHSALSLVAMPLSGVPAELVKPDPEPDSQLELAPRNWTPTPGRGRRLLMLSVLALGLVLAGWFGRKLLLPQAQPAAAVAAPATAQP